MNIPSAIPKATNLIKQFKMLSTDAKQIKTQIQYIHDYYHDLADYSVEIKITKEHLNELVYVMQHELDAIKASLDGILEDMESKDFGT